MDKQDAFITDSQIQYLPSLLAKLERGEIQIPVFQRPFVWKQSQVVELLESIYRGFPIGALFFWLPGEQLSKIGNNNFLLTSVPDEDYLVPQIKDLTYPSVYVLDGVQRLSSLYGVFNWKSIDKPSPFNIVFDLRKEEFLPYKLTGLSKAQISLSALFTPLRLFEAQSQLSNLADSETLIGRAIRLHSRFQEYSVPVVTIRGGDAGDVIEIFERLNTRGTQLTLSDLVMGLMSRADFNFYEVLDGIDERLSERGFSLSRDFFVKVLATILNRSSSPREVLHLRELSSQSLLDACDLGRNSLEKVADFLKGQFGIYSFDSVPYDDQALVLVKLFSVSGTLTAEGTRQVVRWFWRSSFTETFSGRSSEYAMDIIRSADRIIEGDYSSLDIPLEIRPDDFLTRSFVRGRPFSLAISALMAVKAPRSLITGQPIDPSALTGAISVENFQNLYSPNELPPTSKRRLRSSMVIANTIVVTEFERQMFNQFAPQQILKSLFEHFGDQAADVLDSQFISRDASTFIQEGNVEMFLRERAGNMFRFVTALGGNSTMNPD